MLLEGIYGGFDRIASRLNVFKVETVGDCYVAASGLPNPCKKHPVVMARFARACMHKFASLTQKLEMFLGPDTGELELRIGLHSGQVTGGVLRGERSRFQLFGDTMNTAARVESTSIKSRIQLSCVTAELLREAGKGKWLTPRKDRICVPGKGQMQMYWLEVREETQQRERLEGEESKTYKKQKDNYGDTPNGDTQNDMGDDTEISDLFEGTMTLTKLERLVEWNVDVLGRLLVQILATRDISNSKLSLDRQSEQIVGEGSTVLEECQEIITLPKIGVEELQKWKDPSTIELDTKILSQLRQFIFCVASHYQDNPFHNFEHASHVTSSVRKLLTRIVSINNENCSSDMDIRALLGHSYGITSDPLTQFAVVFSAVIHDMDHPGVPNATLVMEKVPMATKYKGKSIAEQNSVDLAWDILMEPQYDDLRGCIYSNQDELRRFRQLVVNVVMATDICDKELQALRKKRWDQAFSEHANSSTEEEKVLDINRKATIVIEHLIQASDVSHTMQHWKIYLKWNELFFMECYGAYKAGRSESDPSKGWYKGEIGFFDFYIIPLAKKLENCGVFGVSSYEYLNYALANRDEWFRNGEDVVKNYLEKYEMLQNEQTG